MSDLKDIGFILEDLGLSMDTVVQPGIDTLFPPFNFQQNCTNTQTALWSFCVEARNLSQINCNHLNLEEISRTNEICED